MPDLLPSQVNREEKVEVFCDDRVFSGWESVSIRAGMDQGAREFQLGVSGTVIDTIPIESEIVITIGGEQVVRGYFEGIADAASNKTHDIDLVGRSRVGQIVDCSATPTSFNNTSILHIARQLASPYAVEVVSEIDEQILASFRVQPGETVWEAVERSVRGKFVILTDDAQGRLVMTRAGASGDDGNVRPLVFGVNILSRSVNLNWAARFQTYKVYGQGTSKGDVHHRQTGSVTDSAVRLPRTLLLVGGAQQPGITAQTRASYEQRTRLGQAITYTATVQGWRDAKGDLWRPNTMVAIWDPFQVWEGTYLLIVNVSFSISSGGATTTTLTCKPRQAYEAPEQTTQRRARGAGRRLHASLLGPGFNSLPGAIYGQVIQNEIARVASTAFQVGPGIRTVPRRGWLARWQQEDLE